MKKVVWGEDPESLGPRNYYRETLIVKNLSKYVKKGVILDAGCGNGTLTFRFAKKGYNVESIDVSKQSITYLTNKVKEKKLEKSIHPQVASIFKLPFKDKFFDGVVCGEVLEHLENDTLAIKELYRTLKKNGYCVVSVPGKMEKWDSVDDFSDHIRRYSKDELHNKFKNAGFQVIDCMYWGFPLTNFWHTNVYVPFLEKKMETGYTVTQSQGFAAQIMKNESIVAALSLPFHVDTLFNFTSLGNSLLLVAKKK